MNIKADISCKINQSNSAGGNCNLVLLKWPSKFDGSDIFGCKGYRARLIKSRFLFNKHSNGLNGKGTPVKESVTFVGKNLAS